MNGLIRIEFLGINAFSPIHSEGISRVISS